MTTCVAAIIQARMGSTRLPGKILADIAGHPALWHVIHRVQRAQQVDKIIVATSELPGDDAVAAFCDQVGIPCFRGSETDVLSRYVGAANQSGCDVLVRITADCPMHDPTVIDATIAAFRRAEVDYASNAHLRTYPDGLDVEVFTLDTLIQAAEQATSSDDREHVTSYILRHPETFRIHHITQPRDLAHLRWTLDYPEDLAFIREVFSHMHGTDFGQQEILDLLGNEPNISAMNQHLAQYGEKT